MGAKDARLARFVIPQDSSSRRGKMKDDGHARPGGRAQTGFPQCNNGLENAPHL